MADVRAQSRVAVAPGAASGVPDRRPVDQQQGPGDRAQQVGLGQRGGPDVDELGAAFGGG
ncbi:hypothetical protein [Geodermatophilus obscurus]|uniref:hypothetical protein n=1 Tax=Geodermatophilus obscurus TaxID=1861 RepID=UPI0031EEB10A